MILDILVRYRTWIGYFFFITCIVLLCLDLQHVQNKYLKHVVLSAARKPKAGKKRRLATIDGGN